jgi:hypothetical protein
MASYFENLHFVNISAVVALRDRPELIPDFGAIITIADCKYHYEWNKDEHGQFIPTKWKNVTVTKVAKNGSFYCDKQWFQFNHAKAYFNSNEFGTLIIYMPC